MSKRTHDEELLLRRFGERLRFFRTLRGLTQEELAYQARFSRSYYTEIETGKRNISLLNMVRLAACLELTLAELLDFDDATHN